MRSPITAGSVLIEESAHLPSDIILLRGSDSDGWAAIQQSRPAFDRTVEELGWTFFFMAGEIKATAFGFDKAKALRHALKRLIAEVKSLHCNSIEISQVIEKSFCGLPYVSVSAHSRHLQKGIRMSSSETGSNSEIGTQARLQWKVTAS